MRGSHGGHALSVEIEYAANRTRLQELLQSVDRPGGFCAHGRTYAAMPVVEVEGAGTLSFPVPEFQIRELLDVAERAPYGKGTETLLDASVRDCWQVDAERIRLGGSGWSDTLARILDEVSAGLGCSSGRLDARLYKLLIYQTGGFFTEHRDTEKCDGMVATLTVTLPASGAGGELIVRHLEEEARIDMNATEPSELAFAAFYADCAHETRPVREGCRLSLVFNLVVRPDDTEMPLVAPDYSRQAKEIARELADWRDSGVGPDKLVWVLEHNYSDAGLSFDALKNADAAVAGVLKSAAEEAECALHAAILHVEESGSVRYLGGGYFDEWGRDGGATEDVEMDEVFDGRYWLDGWASADGTRSDLGEMSLRDGETLPAGALDDAVPDREWLEEASGNEGATLERAYRVAALVIWPEWATVDLLAGEGIDGAVAWVQERIDHGEGAGHGLISLLMDAWPAPALHWTKPDRDSLGRRRMLSLLARHGDAAICLRFLREILVERYDGDENALLPEALALTGAAGSREVLGDLVAARLWLRPDAILDLMRRVDEFPGSGWKDTLRDSLEAALSALPEVLDAATTAEGSPPVTRRKAISSEGLCDLFALAWRHGLAGQAARAAVAVVERPGAVTPERTVPKALRSLGRDAGFTRSRAYLTLWRHAADALLGRSARPPEPPRDWAQTVRLDCDCEHCARLEAFCADSVERVGRFPLRQDLRRHLHRQIDDHRLDMDHETERRGRPYTLVCTKNHASHERRLKEYGHDVKWMRALADFPPEGDDPATAQTRRLQEALVAARR